MYLTVLYLALESCGTLQTIDSDIVRVQSISKMPILQFENTNDSEYFQLIWSNKIASTMAMSAK